MGRFRLGPLGRLMVIDTPERGFSAEDEEVGGVHTSLNGTTTKDVFAYKGRYKINLDGLDPRALSYVEMAYRGALGPDLWFVDEARVNRLAAPASSAWAAWSEADPYSTVNGTRTIADTTSLLLPGLQDGQAVQTPGPLKACTWASTAGGLLRLWPILPVQPGEHVVFSVYATSGTPTLEFTPFSAALVAGAQVGTATVVTAGSPPRRHTTYTVPASGVAALQPCIRHAGAQSSTVTALQLEEGDSPTPWVLGNGCPKVLVESSPLTRRRIGRYADATLTLVEA